MNSTTVPILRYRKASQAIDWLCKAFGFEVFLKVSGDGDKIEHARLTLETNMVMLASQGRAGDMEGSFKLPADVGGITQSILMHVSDPDRIFLTAQDTRARIITEIADSPFGGRLFTCADVESHVWTFSNGDPWEKSW
jgi:uncharacterized glyoxalase superfamily protein PhnB